MIYPEADKLERRVDSRFTLVILAAKRAKQLRDGAPKRIETTSTNPLTIALEEIASGKVTFRVPSHDEVPSRSAMAELEALPGLESAETEAAELVADVPQTDEAARIAGLLRAPGEQVEETVEEEAKPTSEEIRELLAVPGAEEDKDEAKPTSAEVAEMLAIPDEEETPDEDAQKE